MGCFSSEVLGFWEASAAVVYPLTFSPAYRIRFSGAAQPPSATGVPSGLTPLRRRGPWTSHVACWKRGRDKKGKAGRRFRHHSSTVPHVQTFTLPPTPSLGVPWWFILPVVFLFLTIVPLNSVWLPPSSLYLFPSSWMTFSCLFFFYTPCCSSCLTTAVATRHTHAHTHTEPQNHAQSFLFYCQLHTLFSSFVHF